VPSAVEALGKLDILVNNAGVTRDNLIMRMKDEEWMDVIRINLEANFRLARRRQADDEGALRPHHLDHQRRRRDGQSGAGQLCGVEGRRDRHDQGARAGTREPRRHRNCVAPGFIATAMTDDLPEAQKEALNQRIPAGRMGEGSDIAAAVVYLASKEAGYVTGQTLHVNGGMAMLYPGPGRRSRNDRLRDRQAQARAHPADHHRHHSQHG
jgi:3-oxoacyl-[acyl-carrier protein] reductase